MSKMDGLRAMREARYERTIARSGKPAAAPTTRARPPVAPAVTAPVVPAAAADPTACGHRSMNGRTCTREAGHAAKNHRYS